MTADKGPTLEGGWKATWFSGSSVDRNMQVQQSHRLQYEYTKMQLFFLYTRNEKSKNEINNSIHNSTKNNSLRINLTKNLYNENHKTN